MVSVKLAIDAMGGDASPDMIIGGIAIAQRRCPNIFFYLYGDQKRLIPLVEKYCLDQTYIKIVHTDEMITSDMKPSVALRGSKTSSMRLAIEAVASGEADAVVSAGNTGAYMALSKLILKTLKGIDRPAIAAPLPTRRGRSLMLDLGANVECSTDNLVQFAIMGQVYAQQLLKIPSPSVALLNVGAEDLKGNAITKTTHALLKNNHWIKNFCGFVEGNDLLSGKVDVIVTDGFTGNIALKTIEGTFKLFKQFIIQEFRKNFWTRISYLFAKPVLSTFRKQFDPRHNNGAPFLGLNGICVKSHGGTDALGFSYAIRVAVDMVQRDVNRLIREGLENWHEALDLQASNSNLSGESEIFLPVSQNGQS